MTDQTAIKPLSFNPETKLPFRPLAMPSAPAPEAPVHPPVVNPPIANTVVNPPINPPINPPNTPKSISPSNVSLPSSTNVNHSQPPTNPNPGNPPNPGYAPSVPISVYREVIAELQATRAMLDSLHNQNQQLVIQNQQFRQGIERFSQAASQLRQLLDANPEIGWPIASSQAPSSLPYLPDLPTGTPQPSITYRKSAGTPQPVIHLTSNPAKPTDLSPEYFIEQPDHHPHAAGDAERSVDVTGWWLALTLGLIISIAFGAGFLIVPSLLRGR